MGWLRHKVRLFDLFFSSFCCLRLADLIAGLGHDELQRWPTTDVQG